MANITVYRCIKKHLHLNSVISPPYHDKGTGMAFHLKTSIHDKHYHCCIYNNRPTAPIISIWLLPSQLFRLDTANRQRITTRLMISPQSDPLFPLSRTSRRGPPVLSGIAPQNRLFPYSCASCTDGTSGWCSSAPRDILSMPHSSGDFIATSEDLCRAAKALFPSPLLPKQMVSPRPCQTPHWTLFISKVLASCLFKMK